jgi:hypothetical protein
MTAKPQGCGVKGQAGRKSMSKPGLSEQSIFVGYDNPSLMRVKKDNH